MNYNFHYDIAAVVVTVATGIHFCQKKTISTRQSRIFKLLLAVELLATLVDLVTVYTINNPAAVPIPFHYMINMLYLALFNLTPVVYFVYIHKVIRGTAHSKSIEKFLIYAPIAVAEILLLTTPMHGLIFTVDESGQYLHGAWFVLLYSVSLYYVALSQAYVIRYRKVFSLGQIISVSCYTVFCFLVVLLQSLVQNLLVSQFAVSIAVLLIYFSLENPQSYEEKRLGIYNREGFEKLTLDYIYRGIPFQVLGIEIQGMGYIADTFGVENVYKLLKQFAETISGITKKKKVFFMGNYRFALVSTKKDAKWDEFISRIRARFDEPFLLEEAPVTLSTAMCMVGYPDNATRLADILAIMEVATEDARKNTAVPVVYADDDFLDRGRREGRIVQIMKNALHENKFEVYYQPIYSVDKRRYVSAEALIRLKYNKEFISPEEFIPIAERNGMIIEIGEFVFREVCDFIATNALLDKGIEYIDVNLSVVQCMQSTLYEHLLAIMDEYKLPYTCINLEITETAAVMSQETLIENMDRLREHGINFSLDDYGTGFANTAAVIQYPFHTVKLDKSMVWSAMDDQKAMAALKYSIAMLKEMGMQLIAEGVEELRQAQLLEEMGCDFFQGYYYSKPVCGAEFLSKLASIQNQSRGVS